MLVLVAAVGTSVPNGADGQDLRGRHHALRIRPVLEAAIAAWVGVDLPTDEDHHGREVVGGPRDEPAALTVGVPFDLPDGLLLREHHRQWMLGPRLVLELSREGLDGRCPCRDIATNWRGRRSIWFLGIVLHYFLILLLLSRVQSCRAGGPALRYGLRHRFCLRLGLG